MRFGRTRTALFIGIVCALIASAIAGRGDGLYVPFSMPATTCSNQFLRSIAVITGAGTCASIAAGDFPILTGDVTTPGSSLATTIAANAVTNAKAAQMANSTIKCRTTAGTGNAEDCTAAQAAAVANAGSAFGAPNFKVTLTGGNQSLTSGVITKVAFDTVVIDSGSFWSTSNKNYLPTVSGTYMFCTQVAGQATFTLGNDLAMFISKNGISGGAGTALTSYQGLAPTLAAATQAMFDCTITAMNGSTDTIEVDVAVTGTGPVIISNSNPQTYLFGWRIGP